MGVAGSELRVLEMIKDLGKVACVSKIGPELGFTTGYADILIKSLIKGGYIARAGRTTYRLAPKGKRVLEGPPEVPEVKKRPERIKPKVPKIGKRSKGIRRKKR